MTPATKRQTTIPLSAAQQRLWLVEEIEGPSALYNIPIAVRLTGPLDVDALERSLNAIATRHDALRTNFARGPLGEPERRIAPPETRTMRLIPQAVQDEAEALRLATAAAAKPFDLAADPLLRACLFRTAPESHVLLLVVHHIVADGWSMSVIARELGSLYSSLPVDDAPVEATRTEPANVASDHWGRYLDGAPPALNLPSDIPGAGSSRAGATCSFTIEASLAESLHALARAGQATPFAVALAAWAALLSAYSRQDEVVIGSPFANRGGSHTHSMVGYFVNLLPMRLRLDRGQTFHDAVRQSRAAIAGALAHQHIPFDQSPLESVLVFQNTPETTLQLAGLTAEPLQIPTATAKFDLTVILEERAGGWRGTIEYRTARFHAATVERMAANFVNLLRAAAEDPGRPVGELSTLSARERRLLIERWSGAAHSAASRQTIAERFSEIAARHADATALESEGHTLSYAELDRQSARVAAWLRSQGAGPGSLVAVCAGRSFEMIVATLGIVKSGAAYLPLDPQDPPERRHAMLASAGADIVLTRGIAAGAMAYDGASPNAPLPSREDPVYVIYTSGSTGVSKGVCVPHRAVMRLCADPDFVSIDSSETFLQLAPVCFDAATFEIWGALLNGARLVLAPPGPLTLAALGTLIREAGVTTLWLTSGLFHLMVDEQPGDLTGLRQLLAGGDVLSPSHVVRAAAALTQGRVINGYGPTENTTFTCCHTVPPQPDATVPVAIGRPIRGTSVYILDSNFAPAGIGVPGELYTGGDGVAIGYWNAPALTAERFLPNPFGPGRLYRTGDLASWQPDGTIRFHGRTDQQLKIRGFRVEPAELEAALRRHPGVRDAAVVAYEPAPGRKELAAYFVPSPSPVTAAQLQSDLRDTLPEFLLPSALTALDALPVTANGKLDRSRLPAPQRGADAGYVAPRTPHEIGLAAIFEEVLSLDRIGTTGHFFECGGNSLLATQAVSRMRTRLGVDVPLRQIFLTPRVGELAAFLDRSAGPRTAEPIPRLEANGPLALSFAQERLWFLQQLEPGSPFYNVAFALQCEGPLDAGRIEQSLREIVRRHQVLRSTYHEAGAGVVQIVGETSFSLARQDLRALPRRREALETIAREEARRPFDLRTGPVIRATLLALEDREHVLLLTMHHIAADGWSIGVLVNELSALYRGEPLPPLPLQYADYAAWQRQWMEGETYRRQCAYWKDQLGGYPAHLNLPTGRPRPPEQSYRGGSVEFEIGAATVQRLRDLARAQDGTLFMALLAGFAALLSRYSAQDDIIVGSPIANRTRTETESLAGFFVNTLPLRVNLAGDPTFAQLLDRTRAMTLAAYTHQDMPFERLVDELQPERDLSRNPLFQVMFALQNAPRPDIALPGLKVRNLNFERTNAQFDLVLDAWETGSNLLCVLEYSRDLFDRETVERMAAHFQTLLDGAAGEPQTRLSRLPLLSAAERHQMIEDFRGECVEFPLHTTIHELFEQQADRTPDRIAAEHGDEQITYLALDRHANRIAHRLRELGIERNGFAVVLLDRGIGFLAAMLGVLKAGAAFVPVDPGYPAARIAGMVSGSEAQAVITTEEVLGRLPGLDLGTARTLWIDRETAPDTRPSHINRPTDRAYMLYTSGSTGVPKGAILRHDGKINHIYAQFRALAFHGGSAFLQTAPASSDISVWQFLAPVLIGGRTVIADYETLCDPAALWTLLQSRGITVLELVPVALSALLSHAASLPETQRRLPALERALVTGESAPPSLVNWWLELFPAVPIANAYGPTEAADDICQHVVAAPLDPEARSVPIGRPLANLTMYVLDAQLQLLPIGVPGELCVSGVGVGEGYWRDEARTRERFVPNPYAGGGRGDVLYRTGDIGFWRPGGLLECVSRLDDQVKIRGFRMELAGIEAELTACPSVRDAAVLAVDGPAGERCLAAYAVLNEADPEVDGERRRLLADRLHLWQGLHDDDYRATLDYGDPTFNVIGWDSSYGLEPQPISAAGMHEYVDHTVARVLAQGPRRLLEVGCGTGLILFPLVPHLDSYLGIDLSQRSIERLDELRRRPDLRARIPKLEHVTLRHARADQLDGLVPPGSIDTVIFPSVVQYFPGADYLMSVIGELIALLPPDGSLFFGDVKSLPLMELFHTSVECSKARPTVTAGELQERVRAAAAASQELALHPEFFLALPRRYPRISSVDILPKRGWDANEMTRFRYDVAIRLGPAAAPRTPVEWLDWEQAGRPGAEQIGAVAERPAAFAFSGIANARLSEDHSLRSALRTAPSAETVQQLRDRRQDQPSTGLEPEALYELAHRPAFPYDVYLSFARSGVEGRFDAAFVPKGAPPPEFPAAGPEATLPLANDPLREALAQTLQTRLRESLKLRLPPYMIPAAFEFLDRMPTGPSGKVDRRALPAPRFEHGASASFKPPRTPGEQAIAAIWCEVLGRERCGLGEDFFETGGHSLKATQLVSRIRQRLGAEIPVRAVFTHRTIEALAALVPESPAHRQPRLERIPAAPHYAASPAQRRIWVLSQIDEASVAYNMPVALLVEGPLDEPRLEAAFAGVVARHESLRTTFAMVDGELRQWIHAVLRSPVSKADCAWAPDPESAARAEAARQAAQPFDLGEGPLIRLSLLRLDSKRRVLFFNAHHIVCDDVSIGVLVREVMSAYQGATPPRPLGLHYRDFSDWQRRLLDSEPGLAQERYWLARLGGELPLLDLPADCPRPSVKTYRGQVKSFRWSETETAQLEDLARRHKSTLFLTLLAAVKALLYRYTGQKDLIVAVPSAGREAAELEGQIGFYINTLALRDRVEPGAPFSQLLAQVTRHATEAFSHQSYPFDRLVDKLGVRRDPSRNPLCDVAVVMQSGASTDLRLPGVSIQPFDIGPGASKYDLHFVFEVRDRVLCGSIVYNPDLVRDDRIDRLAAHLRTLVRGALDDSETPVDRLALLPPEEERQVTQTHLESVAPPCPTLLQEFAQWVARTPDREAISIRDESASRSSLTYAQLDAAANRVAHRLKSRGVGPEVFVGLFVERSLESIVGLLAILKAGGAYVPIDPAYPEQRVQFILRDSGAPVVLTTSALLPRLGRPDAEVLLLDAAAPEPPAITLDPPDPANAAYMIYTSGSTGEPKGVVVEHRQMSRLFSSTDAWFQWNENEVWTLFHSIAFDFSVWELWGALRSGGRIVLVPQSVTRSPRGLWELLLDERVTVLNQTPSAFRALMDAAAGSRGLCPSLRYVIFGGEALDVPSLRPWFARHGDTHPALVNMYGITETTVHTTYRPIRASDLEHGRSVIGRPLPGLEIRIAGPGDNLAPVGVPGEIRVGGDGVARGYWNRPGLTAQRFGPEAAGQGRWYRSGDLGRYLPNGDIEYLGRLDHQIKIRGFRVELGEIEAACLRIPPVRQALVVAESGGPETRLIAYLVAGPGLDPLALRQSLREQLPEYMIPAFLVPVAAFPLTAHGKADRAALAKLDRSLPAGPSSARAASAVETRLTELLKRMLGVPHVGLNTSFFDAGANSLLLVRLHGELQRELDRQVPLMALYQYPTIESLAGHLTAGAAAPNTVPNPEAHRRAARRLEARSRQGKASGQGAGSQ